MGEMVSLKQYERENPSFAASAPTDIAAIQKVAVKIGRNSLIVSTAHLQNRDG